MNKYIRWIGAAAIVLIWALLTVFAWFGGDEAYSISERRDLLQWPGDPDKNGYSDVCDKDWPGLTADTLMDTTFMQAFEDYTTEQFPLRDRFRQIKALFHYNALLQKDNNNIYVVDGYTAQMDTFTDTNKLTATLMTFNRLYEQRLKDAGCNIYTAIVPDKNYYLAPEYGYLSMDYELMMSMIHEKMPWSQHVDLTGCLTDKDYYFTDTHWRQENLIPVAQKLAEAMGNTLPQLSDYQKELIDAPFYGVHYGHAALPMDPETIYVLNNDLLKACTVTYQDKTGKTVQFQGVYDYGRITTSADLYDLFLSGEFGVITIENPNAATDKELYIFRDSFGRSLTPLLLQDYSKVTLVDPRWARTIWMDNEMNPLYNLKEGDDVLFLYSTAVLNSDGIV